MPSTSSPRGSEPSPQSDPIASQRSSRTGEQTEGPELEAHQTIRRVAAHFGIPFTIERPAAG